MPPRPPNANQQRAIDLTEGPVRIIAGPGSGKTFTLIERLVRLVADKGAKPEEILVATFTEKAASELVTRASNRLADLDIRVNFGEMYIGTIHSIALRIVDEFRTHTRLERNYHLWDEFDQRYNLYLNLNLFLDVPDLHLVIGSDKDTSVEDLKKKSRWKLAAPLAGWINQATEELLEPDDLLSSTNPAAIALGEAMTRYRDLLTEKNALDFAAIQTEAWKLLNEHPEILATLRERIRYVMVDEYQDTNTVQEKLMLLLAGPARNICVVGDDDQSLYRFRGATVRNILEFPDNFDDGECTTLRLDTNYRSHPDIIRFYNDWIDREDWSNPNEGEFDFRVAKTIRPRDDDFILDPAVLRLDPTDDPDEWHESVHRSLLDLRENGNVSDWNQIAFLFSSVRHSGAIALADYLEEQGIPVYAPRSGMFFEREEIMLMVGALLAMFPQTEDLMKSTWKGSDVPAIWGWYNRCQLMIAEYIEKSEDHAFRAFLMEYRQRHFPLTRRTPYTFSDLFYRLLAYPIFARYLGDSAEEGILESRPARNLARFSHLLNRFEYLHNVTVLRPDHVDKDLVQLFGTFLRYLFDGGIDEFEDRTDAAPSGCLPFMTIHQSKGLEFPVVFVTSLYDRPRTRRSALGEFLQENHYNKKAFEPFDRIAGFDFQRKYYVAFSRPKSLLVLTGQHKRGSWRVPSKAFAPVYDELPAWSGLRDHLHAIPIDPIEGADLKPQYAFTSHIGLYENCPRQYKFFRTLDFVPARSSNVLFGSLVHQTIEDVHRAVLSGETAGITDDRIENWFADNYRNLSARHRQYLSKPALAAALRHVMTYVDSRRRAFGDVLEAEVDVSLVKEAYILTGTVDLIRGKNETVEIVDFKSDDKPDVNDPEDRARLERYRRQLEVYGHIVAERTGREVSRLHLFYTGENVGNPYISWDHEDERIAETIGQIEGTIEGIERGEFGVVERPVALCKNCDFERHCDHFSRTLERE